MLQVFDNPAQAVAVGHDQQGVVAGERRQDFAFPVGHDAADGVEQRLGAGQLRFGYVAVAGKI